MRYKKTHEQDVLQLSHRKKIFDVFLFSRLQNNVGLLLVTSREVQLNMIHFQKLFQTRNITKYGDITAF